VTGASPLQPEREKEVGNNGGTAGEYPPGGLFPWLAMFKIAVRVKCFRTSRKLCRACVALY